MITSIEFMGSEIRIESDDVNALMNFLYSSKTFCDYASLHYSFVSQLDIREDALDLAICFGAAYRELFCKK